MKLIKFLLIAVYCLLITDYAYSQEARGEKQEVKADSTIIKSDLIKKYEAEILKLQKSFDQVYLQIATTDPIVTNRMNQLLESHPQSVSIMTAVQVFKKMIEELKPKTEQKEIKN